MIAEGYEPVKVNMLLSIAYHMNGDTFMSEKYKAISNLMQLRELGKIPPVEEMKDGWLPKASHLTTTSVNLR